MSLRHELPGKGGLLAPVWKSGKVPLSSDDSSDDEEHGMAQHASLLPQARPPTLSISTLALSTMRWQRPLAVIVMAMIFFIIGWSWWHSDSCRTSDEWRDFLQTVDQAGEHAAAYLQPSFGAAWQAAIQASHNRSALWSPPPPIRPSPVIPLPDSSPTFDQASLRPWMESLSSQQQAALPGVRNFLACAESARAASSSLRVAVVLSSAPAPSLSQLVMAHLDEHWCVLLIAEEDAPAHSVHTIHTLAMLGARPLPSRSDIAAALSLGAAYDEAEWKRFCQHVSLQDALAKKLNLTGFADSSSSSSSVDHPLLHRVSYVDATEQGELPYATGELLTATGPRSSLGRKNLGYLLAMHADARVILDLDEDSIFRSTAALPDQPPQRFPYFDHADRFMVDRPTALSAGVWNPYPYFGLEHAAPRGLPSSSSVQSSACLPVMQQYLANITPDVDPLWLTTLTKYRCSQGPTDPLCAKPRGIFFHTNRTQPQQRAVAVPIGTFTPTNTHSTSFLQPMHWALFFPATLDAQVADTWRSYVMETLLTYLQFDSPPSPPRDPSSTSPPASRSPPRVHGCVIFHPPVISRAHLPSNDADRAREERAHARTEALLELLRERRAGGTADLRRREGKASCAISTLSVLELQLLLWKDIAEAGLLPESDLAVAAAWMQDLNHLSVLRTASPAPPSSSPEAFTPAAVAPASSPVAAWPSVFVIGCLEDDITMDTASSQELSMDMDCFHALTSETRDRLAQRWDTVLQRQPEQCKERIKDEFILDAAIEDRICPTAYLVDDVRAQRKCRRTVLDFASRRPAGATAPRIVFLLQVYTDLPMLNRLLRRLLGVPAGRPDQTDAEKAADFEQAVWNHAVIFQVDAKQPATFFEQLNSLIQFTPQACVMTSIDIVYQTSSEMRNNYNGMAWIWKAYESAPWLYEFDFFVPLTGADYVLLSATDFDRLLLNVGPKTWCRGVITGSTDPRCCDRYWSPGTRDASVDGMPPGLERQRCEYVIPHYPGGVTIDTICEARPNRYEDRNAVPDWLYSNRKQEWCEDISLISGQYGGRSVALLSMCAVVSSILSLFVPSPGIFPSRHVRVMMEHEVWRETFMFWRIRGNGAEHAWQQAIRELHKRGHPDYGMDGVHDRWSTLYSWDRGQGGGGSHSRFFTMAEADVIDSLWADCTPILRKFSSQFGLEVLDYIEQYGPTDGAKSPLRNCRFLTTPPGAAEVQSSQP
jgi:hypothetical protein